MVWFSPEMVSLRMVSFPLQVIITITCSNFSWWYLSCQWNDAQSVISWDFKNLWRSVGTDNFHWLEGWKWTSKKGRPYRVVVLMVSMSNYTVLTSYENPQYDFNKEFRKLDPCKNWGGYHIARGHPKCGKFIIKMGATKMEFNFNQADMWFNP